MTKLCKHHWLIESSSAMIVKGVCKLCGEEKTFENFQEFHTHREQMTEGIRIAHAQKEYRGISQNMTGEQV